MKPNRRADPIARRKAALRARVLRHFEEVTRNVSATGRHFGIHRSQFYEWRRRRKERGPQGLLDDKRGPKVSPWRTLPHIEALVLKIRAEKACGAQRLSYYLQRYHEVYLSVPTIRRILREHQVPRISLKRYRPGPKKRREISSPGQSVQVDVKHVKVTSGRLYQFTAIDEATRFRVLKVYDHNSTRSAIDFVEELRRKLPVAIRRIQTDWGSEFGSHFTWHLEDIGIEHKHIPPGCPEVNGKVERSHRTDQHEFYGRFLFRTPAELRAALRSWEREYNERRPHLALKGRTPAECLLELRCRPVTPVGVSA